MPRKKRKIVVNLSMCRYPLVQEAVERMKWTVTKEADQDWDLFWTDTSVVDERVMRLKRHQRINHFAGMASLAKKTSLAKTIRRLELIMPDTFSFMPKTWILPVEAAELKAHFKKNPGKYVIVKPDGGCQGKGIVLTDDANSSATEPNGPPAVAQEYIVNPFLIDSFKFDIRIYVLITSCDPLRIYLYQEGIARFCTEKYRPPDSTNASIPFVHLTNWAINKHKVSSALLSSSSSSSRDWRASTDSSDKRKGVPRMQSQHQGGEACAVSSSRDGKAGGEGARGSKDGKAGGEGARGGGIRQAAADKGGRECVRGEGASAMDCWGEGAVKQIKRSLTSVLQALDGRGIDSAKVWDDIGLLVVKTIMAGQPALAQTYRSLTSRPDTEGCCCFELLGLDVMLDSSLKPWLLEVNHSPSFACDCELDKLIKGQLLTDTLALINMSAVHKRWIKRQDKSESACRLYGAMPSKSQLAAGSRVLQMRIGHEERHQGNYSRIYPPGPNDRATNESYDKIFAASQTAFDEGWQRHPSSSSSSMCSTCRPLSSHTTSSSRLRLRGSLSFQLSRDERSTSSSLHCDANDADGPRGHHANCGKDDAGTFRRVMLNHSLSSRDYYVTRQSTEVLSSSSRDPLAAWPYFRSKSHTGTALVPTSTSSMLHFEDYKDGRVQYSRVGGVWDDGGVSPRSGRGTHVQDAVGAGWKNKTGEGAWRWKGGGLPFDFVGGSGMFLRASTAGSFRKSRA